MNKLGVLGGMGPLATIQYCEKVIQNTHAEKDQDNIDMVIINDPLVPDRTDYLTKVSDQSPLPQMLKDLKYLEQLDCDIIALPCNTAHYFYDEIQRETTLPILNMVDLTLKKCFDSGFKKVGLMATYGTVYSKIYEIFNNYGITIFNPSKEYQEKIEGLIYNYVKKNQSAPKDEYLEILDYFKDNGVNGIILGCTELSVIQEEYKIPGYNIIDSTDVLVEETIRIFEKLK